jgi:hypothetical protein
MQVRILVGGIYRGAYYSAHELVDLPAEVAGQLIKRQLAVPVAGVPELKRTGSRIERKRNASQN